MAEYQSELRGKLNPVCLSALRNAVALCQSRTFYEVDIPHVLYSLLDMVKVDWDGILSRFDISQSLLKADLEKGLDSFRTGNGTLPAASPRLTQWFRDAWLTASLEFSSSHIRSGHLLLSVLDNPDWLMRRREWRLERLAAASADQIRGEWDTITAASREKEFASAQQDSATVDAPGGEGALGRFCQDVTARAREGKLDPVLGRDFEIRQIVDILMRRRQNNPILTGEAGVGKTAVVEGFAIKIAAGDVPEPLRGVRILSLDIGLMQAGAGVRGEFENRLKSLIAEVAKASPPVILFIDEAHTIIGAGAGEGKADAANLIKPALARGELRTIAATTWAEYKKYFEKDAALARRFQVIRVEEPDEETGIVMLRGLAEKLTLHHQVPVLPEAVDAGVRLSARYISGRLLPDKAVSLLDTACARVAIGRAAPPAAVEEARARVVDRRLAAEGWERERAAGTECAELLSAAEAKLLDAKAEQKRLEKQWRRESRLGEAIRSLREALVNIPLEDQEQRLPVAVKLNKARRLLEKVQGDSPLVAPEVDAQAVASVVAEWTGIPAGRVSNSEKRTLLELEDTLRRRVVGQDDGLRIVSEAVRASRAGLADPRKPAGTFLFYGPSGVGKTESALALAETLFGSESALTVINMSEFKEEHKVSLLTGSPPGYVGYGEGGRLTEAVRRRPYSVLLLDEMEKAHPGVQEVFYQVFDKGTLRDGEGREIDFRHTVIIAASNACGERLYDICSGGERPSHALLSEMLWPELLRVFKPAFLGRLTPAPFYPLGDEELLAIARIHLERLADRTRLRHGVEVVWGKEVERYCASFGDAGTTGGRVVEQALSRMIIPQLSTALLADELPQCINMNVVNGNLEING